MASAISRLLATLSQLLPPPEPSTQEPPTLQPPSPAPSIPEPPPSPSESQPECSYEEHVEILHDCARNLYTSIEDTTVLKKTALAHYTACRGWVVRDDLLIEEHKKTTAFFFQHFPDVTSALPTTNVLFSTDRFKLNKNDFNNENDYALHVITSFNSKRKVQGQGDCFYTSSLLNILNQPEAKRHFSQFVTADLMDPFTSDIASREKTFEILKKDPTIKTITAGEMLCMIHYVRQHIAKYFEQVITPPAIAVILRQTNYCNNYQPPCTQCPTFQHFIQNHVKTMGKEAEEFVLHAFANIFSFRFTIIDNSAETISAPFYPQNDSPSIDIGAIAHSKGGDHYFPVYPSPKAML